MYEKNCSKCKGKGYLPEFNYVKDGLCFTCLGTGSKALNIKYPELMHRLRENLKKTDDSTKIVKVAELINDFQLYDKEHNDSKNKGDIESINYFEIKMNEIITKLNNL